MILKIMESDEKDPRYIEYIKITKNPTWIGYQIYCSELYDKEIREALLKYANRNERLLNELNHTDTFLWLQNYMKNKPTEMFRDKVGDSYFNASIIVSSCYNTLIMELSRDELDKETVNYYLTRINTQLQFLK